MAAAAAAIVVVIFVLAATTAGHDIDAATQHFMLFYAGVFALIGLTGSVMVGLVATDRTMMKPGHRVMAQAVHRATSFGALAFLVIHIVTEILAQRVHVIDAFIPFLSPYRTFYIGLGTIASDLILLIVVTSILRKRFTAHGKAWRWRAIHYCAYAAFVFGVLHGLLGGRAARPYVDWSYGLAIAVTALGLAVRFLAISLRPRESLSTAPGPDRTRAPGAGASPLHAAAFSLAQAQLGPTVQVLPGGMAGSGAATGMNSGSWAALPVASAWSSPSGPFPVLGPASARGPASALGFASALGPASAAGPAPAYAGAGSAAYPPDPGFETYGTAGAYRDPGFRPLGAPPYGDGPPAARRPRPYLAAEPTSVLGAPLPPPGPGRAPRQPLYEPEYDGPPRFVGAPRRHVPQDELSSYPYSQPGQQLGTGYPVGPASHEDLAGRGGPGLSRAIEPPRPGPAPPARPDQPHRDNRSSGPIPRLGTGPMPRADTGPMPRVGTGPIPRVGTGPMPRAGTGPIPRVDTGPMPRVDTGPMPRADSGPMPRAATGPIPRVDTGPMPRAGTGPMPRPTPGSMPWSGPGPTPRADTGSFPRADTGSFPRADTGSFPRADTGSFPHVESGQGARGNAGRPPYPGTGPVPGSGSGPGPRAGSGPMPRVGAGPAPGLGTGPMPRVGDGQPPRGARGSGPRPGPALPGSGPGARPATGPMPRLGPGPAARPGPGPSPRPDLAPLPSPGTGSWPRPGAPLPAAEPDPGWRGDRSPGEAGRMSRRPNPADPRDREVPGPTGGEWP